MNKILLKTQTSLHINLKICDRCKKCVWQGPTTNIPKWLSTEQGLHADQPNSLSSKLGHSGG